MLEEYETAKLALEYLKVLQEGRIKPDRNQAFPTIRDSVDNVSSCERVKQLLDNYFEKHLNNQDEQG